MTFTTRLPCAHVVAWKASHSLHVRLARRIAAAQVKAQEEELEGLPGAWPEVDGAWRPPDQ